MGLANQQRRIEDRANWIGGIIDGEGMITAKRRNNRGTSWIPTITIANTDPIIIDEVISVMQILKIPHYVQKKEYKRPNGMAVKWEILVNGFKRCLVALPILIPYLVGKRERAELLLEWCQKRMTKPIRFYDDDDYAILTKIRRTPLFRSQTARKDAGDNLRMIQSGLM